MEKYIEIENKVNIDDDEIPEINQTEPITKLGDIYILGGKHRVMCGDSTNKNDVAKLMDGKKAHFLLKPLLKISY